MSAPALLRGLSERAIRVVVTGDRLRLRGPQDVLTAEAMTRCFLVAPVEGDCAMTFLLSPCFRHDHKDRP